MSVLSRFAMSPDALYREQQLRAMSQSALVSWLMDAPAFEQAVRDAEERRTMSSMRRVRGSTLPSPGLFGDLADDDEDDDLDDDDDEDDDEDDNDDNDLDDNDDLLVGMFAPRGDGIARLAWHASSDFGMAEIVNGFDVVTNGLLRAALWCDGVIDDRAIAEQMLSDASAIELDESADRLIRVFFAQPRRKGRGPWLRLRDDVKVNVAAPGVSLHALEGRTSEHLADTLKAHGSKPLSNKAQRFDALRQLLTNRDQVARAVASTPAASQAVFWRLVSAVEPMTIQELGVRYFAFGWSPWSVPNRASTSEIEPLARLGLIDGDRSSGFVWTWRETIRCFPEKMTSFRFMRRNVRPQRGPLAIERDTRQVPGIVSDAQRVYEAWRREPPPALNDGGLGVAPVRALAKALKVPAARVGVSTNVLVRRGLLQCEVSGYEGRGRNRRAVFAWKAVANEAWEGAPPTDRWAAMVAWWLKEIALDEWKGAPERLCSDRLREDTLLARTLFVRFLMALEPGKGMDAEDLAISLWRAYPTIFAPTLSDGLIAVARALDLVPSSGPVGLTAAARALLSLRHGDIEIADDTSFVIQADHTIIAPLSLRHDVAAALARIATTESEGGAKVMRVTETSLARAFEHGQSASDIEAFLKAHSAKEVPQSVVYLVHDIERRRGRLSIVDAVSVIVSDDPALVAQAVKVPAAKLRAVGSFAAVSSLPAAALEAALASKGVLGLRLAASPVEPMKDRPGGSSQLGSSQLAARPKAPGRVDPRVVAIPDELGRVVGPIGDTSTKALVRALRAK